MSRTKGKRGRTTKKKVDQPIRVVECATHGKHVERWCENHQRFERVS